MSYARRIMLASGGIVGGAVALYCVYKFVKKRDLSVAGSVAEGDRLLEVKVPEKQEDGPQAAEKSVPKAEVKPTQKQRSPKQKAGEQSKNSKHSPKEQSTNGRQSNSKKKPFVLPPGAGFIEINPESDGYDSEEVEGPTPDALLRATIIQRHAERTFFPDEGIDDSGPSYRTRSKASQRMDDPPPPPPAVESPNINLNTPLGQLGYFFDGNVQQGEGVLKQISNGQKFRFVDQSHYERLGAAVTGEVYRLMQTYLDLMPVTIPVDPVGGEPTSFIFVSPRIQSVLNGGAYNGEKVLILIHGSGAVRAGQWARSLIMNDDLKYGSMMPYIIEAQKRDYDLIITNGNDSQEKGVRRGNTNSHVSYVWENVVDKIPNAKVAIVAHSAGGYNTVKLASDFLDDFYERVFAVALTDSAHGYIPEDVKHLFGEIAQNWVASNKPVGTKVSGWSDKRLSQVSAGHTRHEWTTCAAQDSVFAFLDQKESDWADLVQRRNAAKQKYEEEQLAREQAVLKLEQERARLEKEKAEAWKKQHEEAQEQVQENGMEVEEENGAGNEAKSVGEELVTVPEVAGAEKESAEELVTVREVAGAEKEEMETAETKEPEVEQKGEKSPEVDDDGFTLVKKKNKRPRGSPKIEENHNEEPAAKKQADDESSHKHDEM